ncbi:MAG: YqaJ viral recombinase family protein [Gammaproteobacteria bacterium]|nr:YqaJ viral recombinase family protein [Gammaproteobacteria bacterium]
MIILDVEQRSPEWFAAKAGIPGASQFDMILTPGGKVSTQSVSLVHQLVAEIISLKRLDSGYTSYWMERGMEVEQEAIDFYAFDKEVEVQQVGLCYQDERRLWSCSPDGLLPEQDGGLELKCPSPKVHIDYLLAGTLPGKYKPQVQGSLWITGADWWDFMSYHPGLPTLIVRVERDEAYIGRLAKEVERVSGEVQQKVNIIKEKYNV